MASTSRQYVSLYVISMDPVLQPRRCSAGRDKTPDLLYHGGCRLRWLSYGRRDRHDHRLVIRHGFVQSGAQTRDESERDPIEAQPGSGVPGTPCRPRLDCGDDKGNTPSSDGEARVGRTIAHLQRRSKVRGNGLDRGLFKPLRQAPPSLCDPRSPAYLPGFTNLNVIRSDSPMARYFARSWSCSANVGGSVQTPSG